MQSNIALHRTAAVIAALASLAAGSAALAAPQVVSGPSENPKCYVPWTADTKFFKFPAKKGPYTGRTSSNGFVVNTWRIQMIQTR